MDSLSRRLRPALVVLVLASGLLGLSSSQAGAESASSELRAFQGGALDGGDAGTCAVLQSGNVRCWGFGGNGELGYGNTTPIGDTETPGSVGPVDVGTGRTARAISSGTFHSCALLDDGNVRCWGFGSNGALGYGNTTTIGNDPGETPGTVGPVNLGAGRTARAVTAGGSHSCALLDDGNVRCWGAGGNGKLGYGNTTTIGDTETPGSVGPVDLGAGRTARAITAGGSHTCALLDDGNVRCWGEGDLGRLGYANTTDIGDNVGETPGTVGPVDLGAGRTARAITAGDSHTCALLDDGNVRCWGNGADGRLGYGNTTTIGDNVGETPGSVGTVNLGLGRTARAITAGTFHTCALLDDGNVRCWGNGGFGQLGYGNTDTIGDDPGETGTAGPVNLGAGRTARAITAGTVHTCALLDDGNVRCWGANANGELGYGNTTQIGDDPGETGTAGPVALGGPLPAKVADLSLGMTASETSRQVGEQVTLTLTVTNSGPDTLQAHSIAVALPGGLTALSATPSQGYWNATAGRWNPLTLASGASATLAIVAQVNAVGAHRADAAVATSELLDPDSIPLGAFPNPDDRASATVTGAGAVGPTGPTGPAGTAGTDGQDGTNGTDGTDGTNGLPGPTGPAGPSGPQGVPGLATVLGQASYRVRRQRKLRVRYGVSRAAGVTLEIRKGSRTIQRARRQATAGPNTFTITPKRAGRFTLRLTARANGQTARDTAKLRVR